MPVAHRRASREARAGDAGARIHAGTARGVGDAGFGLRGTCARIGHGELRVVFQRLANQGV